MSVELVAHMGNDLSIVNAARVSFDQSSGELSERDKGLIRFLMRERHASPFEHVVFTFKIDTTIAVAREWLRHRTQCLAGDTELYFDLPKGEKRGGRSLYRVRIDDFFRRWHEGTEHRIARQKPTLIEQVDPDRWYTVADLAETTERTVATIRGMIRDGRLTARSLVAEPGRPPVLHVQGQAWHDWASHAYQAHVPMRERLGRMKLRMCDEATGDIAHTAVTDIWQTGEQPVYRVTLENGYSLTMTENHRCLTEHGWMTLGEATALRLSASGGVTWSSEAPALAVNGIPAYRDRQWLTEQRENGASVAEMASEAGCSYHTIRKYLREHGLSFAEAEKAKIRAPRQRGRHRPGGPRGPLSGIALENVRRARSGANSNFWKGGLAADRASIARWITGVAPRVHQRCDYTCAICKRRGGSLVAHHADPVWNNAARARDEANLVSLCAACHRTLHARHLELPFRDAFEAGATYTFPASTGHRERPAAKPTPSGPRLRRTWSRIATIEYAGVQPTYDIEVEGPYHNFVANGFIVHNSFNEFSTRYAKVEEPEYYLPDDDHMRTQVGKPGAYRFEDVDPELAAAARERMGEAYDRVSEVYRELVEMGIAREVARNVLPLGMHTKFFATVNLRNVFNFLSLRTNENALREIREEAAQLEELIAPIVPVAYQAWVDMGRGQV